MNETKKQDIGAFALLALSLGIFIYASTGIGRAVAQTEPENHQKAYSLRTGDEILVEVYGEPELSGTYPVQPPGIVFLPLIGELAVLGMTAGEVASKITTELKGRFLSDPLVTVQIHVHQTVNVLGWVERPGTIPYRPGMTVREAIIQAGGFRERARQDRILVQRTDEVGEPVELAVLPDDPVQPTDTVSVPDAVPCYECDEDETASLKGFQALGLTWRPAVDVEVGYTDNLFREESGADIVSTGFSSLRPGLWADGDVGDSFLYSLGYEVAIRRYFSSSADNHENQYASGRARYRITGDTDIELRIDHIDDHEIRGEELTLGDSTLVDAPIPRQLREYGLRGRYGKPANRFEMYLDVSQTEQRYDSFPELTQQRERDTSRVDAEIAYELTPKLDASLFASHADIDFLRPNELDIEQDNQQSRWTAGIAWQALAKTEGLVRIGYLNKKFDDQNAGDVSEPAWDAVLIWRPRTYSTVKLEWSQDISEGSRAADNARLGDFKQLSWTHNWNDRVSTNVKLVKFDKEFRGAPNRDDTEYHVNLGVAYEFSEQLKVSGDYQYSTLESNRTDFEFERNVVSVGVRWEL